MIYLFYGEDKYRLAGRLAEIRKQAGADGDSVNYREMSGSFKGAEIIAEATAMPFLAEKRVLVLEGFLSTKDKSNFESIIAWLPAVPQETELVFVEDGSPDQRLAISKTLKSLARTEAFANLGPAEVIKQIETLTAQKNGAIERSASVAIQLYLGSDLGRISLELDKLISYDKNITKDNVDLLVDAGYFNTIFDLTDAISNQNQKKAIHCLEKALATGENETYLLTMIVSQVRNLLLVSDLKSHGLSESEIVSRSKLHPFVVKKSLAMIRNFTTDQLVSMHRQLLDIDIATKSGGADSKTLLTSFVLKVTNSRQ